MKKISLVMVFVILISLLTGCMTGNASGKLKDVVKTGENRYTCTYDGVKHDFLIYLPSGSGNAPLVMLLHGYAESADQFRSKTDFHEAACPRGYAAVYVDGSSNKAGGAGANGWNSGISSEGNDDVAFLRELAVYLQEKYSLNKDRTYAVGFSNGAFMTHRLAMEAQDTFSGCVSVAGKMPKAVWEKRNESNNVSFFQVTGEKDNVVPKHSDRSADSAIDPAIEDVVDYWVTSDGLSFAEESEIGKGSKLTKYQAEGKRSKVWNLSVKDGYHSWPDDRINAFVINDLILDFFDAVN